MFDTMYGSQFLMSSQWADLRSTFRKTMGTVSCRTPAAARYFIQQTWLTERDMALDLSVTQAVKRKCMWRDP